jgi:hypothetical protein
MTMLSRFRANPRKVRVAIRRDGDGWLATVSAMHAGLIRFEGRANGPRKALAKALRTAESFGLDGLDLSMSWAYDHPQRAEP